MRTPARRKAGIGALPVLLLLVGIAIAVAAWVFLPSTGSPDSVTTTAEGGDSSSAALEPGRLANPDAIPDRVPYWEPGGVLPPDSPYRAGVRPTDALVRGRVTARQLSDWPHLVEVRLERQDDASVVGKAYPTREQPVYRFESVPFGSYRLRLEADGCQPISMLLTTSVSSPDLFQDLPLQSAAGVKGWVRNRQGENLAGVPVTVEPLPRNPRDLVLPLETMTDAEGNYSLQGLTEGEYAVYPGPAHSPVGERVVILIGPGAPQAWAGLEVPPLGSARVVLEDLQSLGFAGVRVQAQRVRLPAGEQPYQETRSVSTDGVLRFTTLPPGDYAFTAWGGPFRNTLREARITLELEPEVRIPLRQDPRDAKPR